MFDPVADTLKQFGNIATWLLTRDRRRDERRRAAEHRVQADSKVTFGH